MPHGNSKKNYSYRRLLPSTQERLKESLKNKKATAKEALDAVCCSVGDVTNARSLGELPRGPQHIYNARYVAKKMDSQAEDNPEACKKAKDSLCLDSIWTLLERAKREEERSRESIFIREYTIHPDLFYLLFWPTIVNWKKLASFAPIQVNSVYLGLTQRLTFLTEI